MPEKLVTLADEVAMGAERSESVRTLLSWFRAERRGRLVNHEVQSALRRLRLSTRPNFRFASMDEAITFEMLNAASADDDGDERSEEIAVVPFVEAAPVLDDEADLAHTITEIEEPRQLVSSVVADPTYRVGRLVSERRLLSVSSDDSVCTAVTHMLANGFSQLPVLDGDRNVRGKISWRSIGARLATGAAASVVRECIEPCEAISADASLFSAIDTILRDECVLVRDRTRLIIGIVTSHDLSVQFNQFGEPFLLLGEIENHVRRLLAQRFTEEELRAACDPSDDQRIIGDMSDLSLGECLRLIDNPLYWERLDLPIDRRVFSHYLNEVREIRNGVMHFDPKGIADTELDRLRMTVAFFQQLINIQAI